MFLKYSAKSAKINCDNSHNSGKNTNPSVLYELRQMTSSCMTLHYLITRATVVARV